jgi:hypothetical protein
VEDCCLKIVRAFAVSVSAYKSRDPSRKPATPSDNNLQLLTPNSSLFKAPDRCALP